MWTAGENGWSDRRNGLFVVTEGIDPFGLRLLFFVRNFTGAEAVSGECSLMIKWALPAVAAILGLCFSASAQEMKTSSPIQPATLTLSQASPHEMVEGRAALERTGSFRTLNNVWYSAGPLTLLNGRLFSFPSAFGWAEATPSDFLPAFTAEALPGMTPVTTLAGDAGSRPVGLLRQFDYVGGEVGVFYGRSTGKFKGDVTQAYFVSEVVDGNTHIIVGGSYGHSSGKAPRIIGR